MQCLLSAILFTFEGRDIPTFSKVLSMVSVAVDRLNKTYFIQIRCFHVHVYNNICCRCRSLLSVKDGGVSKIIPLRPDGLFAYRLFNVFQVTTTAENLISIGRKCAIEEHGGRNIFHW